MTLFFFVDSICRYQGMCDQWSSRSQALRFMGCETVKKFPRAVQKVWRGYRGQPNLLLDILRSSIVLEDISSVLHCLTILAESEEVEIVRIKNRFDRRYDSTASAGYWDLSMNLKLRDTGFIVELQLHLQCMIAIKSNDGHRRYVKFRDSQAD